MLPDTEPEIIEAIQAWITEDPARLDYIREAYWIGLSRGAAWAVKSACTSPVPPSPWTSPSS